MNIFKSMTLAWWQIGVFKLGMLALGVLIGAYFQGVVLAIWPALAIVALGALGYISYVWLRQPEVSA